MDAAQPSCRLRLGLPLAAATLAIGLTACGGDGGAPPPPAVAGVALVADAATTPASAVALPSISAAPGPPSVSAAAPPVAPPVASPVASPVAPIASPSAPAAPPAVPPPPASTSPAPDTVPVPAPVAATSAVTPPAAPNPPATTEPPLGPADPAWLLRSAPVAVLTRQAIDATVTASGWSQVAGPARCDVVLHSVLHATRGPRGEATDASAAVLVPQGPGCTGPLPILSYSRGTESERGRTLAAADDRETLALAAFFATRGHVVVASDYLGYAQSTYPYHPYLHAESQARVTVDALRAARALLARLGVAESGRMVLTGYSQGGHVALAAQRAIERDRPAGVAVHATGAMSGPYDLAGFASDLGALLRLMQTGGEPVLQTAVLRLGGLLGAGLLEWLAQRDLLRDVLQSNSVIGWRPLAPVMLCGGARDPVVPFANTLRAAEDFAARGATPTVVDVERVPSWRPLLPPAGAGPAGLSSYHQGIVPPLCFAAVREALLEPAR
jgi:predicted esterase